ncbi:MAG TPA: GntR family transcriptional regulator, partial [Steroidobacteraceae bacterium]|nr:GntR family transcriptional regulator [Steroidobacteraceae bacterium]
MSFQAAAARYLQVKNIILEQIAGGRLPAGARVPSENELTRTLAVSRMTANRRCASSPRTACWCVSPASVPSSPSSACTPTRSR